MKKNRLIFHFLASMLFVDHLQAQQPRLIYPYFHEGGTFRTIMFSPDGKRILTTGDNNPMIWDARSGILLASLTGHTGFVNNGNFSPDGKKIITASNDSTARIWDALTGELITVLKAGDFVTNAMFSPGGNEILTAASDTTKLWNARDGMLITTLDGVMTVGGAFFSPDGNKIAIGSMFPKVFDAHNGRILSELKKFNIIRCGAFSGDSKKIAVNYYDSSVTVSDTENGNLLLTLKGHNGFILSVAFSPDGSRIATASTDSTAKLWDARSGAMVANLKHKNHVYHVSFAPGGSRLVTSSLDYTAKIWDAGNGTLVTVLRHEGVNAACFSPDQSKIATISYDGAKLWVAENGEHLVDLKGHVPMLVDAVFSADGSQILSFGYPVRLWDSFNGTPLSSIKPGGWGGSLSPDGRQLVLPYFADSSAAIYDARTGTLLSRLRGHKSYLYCASYSHDGDKIITGSMDSTAKIWLSKTGALVADLKGHPGAVMDASFSPDDQMVVTSTAGLSKLWKANNGNHLYDINGTSWNATFSNDSKKIITPGNMASKIWSVATARAIMELENTGGGSIMRAAFSPDGNKLITAGPNHVARIWDCATKTVMGDLAGHSGDVRGASYSPDGKRILTASTDNTFKIWDASTRHLLSTFMPIDSTDYFIQIPSGYYLCTPNAARLLHYSDRALNVITFEQLDVKYNRPDLVLHALGSSDISLIRAYYNAWQKRMKKLGFDTSLFQRVNLQVPVLSIENSEGIAYNQTSKELSLKIHAIDDSSLLDRYNTWVNEVPLFGVKGISLKGRNLRRFDTTIFVTLSAGDNAIVSSVTNTGGLESYRQPLTVNFKAPKPTRPKLYFIGIGTDRFKDSRYNLQWSVKDIHDLAVNLKNKYGADCIIDTLFNEAVSVDAVRALKLKLSAASEEDKVIVAYSGHGILNKNYDYFLSAYNINFQTPQEEGLPYELLENLLDDISPRKKLMLIDACHSGEVDKEEMQQYRQSRSKLDSIGIMKGIELTNVDSSRVGMKSSVELMQELFVNVGKSTGATVISAASGTQFALEKSDLKNGAFTYSILEFMQQHDHATVNELKQYVNKRVPELTAGLQVPTTRTENIQANWEVW